MPGSDRSLWTRSRLEAVLWPDADWFRWVGLVMAVLGATGWAGSPSVADEAGSPAIPPAVEALEPVDSPWFVVFDAIRSRGKPDLSEFGLQPLEVLYVRDLWGAGHREIDQTVLPPENRVRQHARAAARTGRLVCLDIEHWRLHDVSDEEFEQNLAKLMTVVDWIRHAEPGIRVGYYRLLPRREPYVPLLDDPDRIQAWRDLNERMWPLAEKVDVVFPSLYTFYDDFDRWRQFAEAQVAEARRYGKQVYIFLYPRFHPSREPLEHAYIPADFWRKQLAWSRRYADGVVIWRGAVSEWDEDAPWWHETKAFTHSLREDLPPPHRVNVYTGEGPGQNEP